MSTDFSQLVLGPCMDAFGKPVVVTPLASQPGAPPYPNRGVWQTDNISVVTEGEGQFSTRVLKFGIKMDEYAVPPQQGDVLTFKLSDLPTGYRVDWLNRSTGSVDFIVDNDQPDFQGGSTMILKRRNRV